MAACVACGCGGDDEEDAKAPGGGARGSAAEAAVFKGLTDYGEAVKANDPEAACGQLTESAQEEAAAVFPGTDSCESAHRQALGALGAEKREQLAEQLGGVKNYEVKISGATAAIEFPGRAGAKPVKMRRVGGDWKVDQNTLFFNREED
ncbi:MAG TPA: hypothetical protein VF712_20290 [Thermoleophilaceae bacterium]